MNVVFRFIVIGFAFLLATSLVAKSLIEDPKKVDYVDKAIANIVSTIQKPKISSRSVSITEFGAQAGLNIDSRSAINSAITTLSRKGGGRVIIPKGIWLSNGPVILKSGIDLHLEQGATLLFGSEAKDYLPVVKQRWEGTEVYTYSPLIYANNVKDVAITGLGIIDGNGDSEFHPWYKQQSADIQALRSMGIEGVPVDNRIFGKGHYLRPPLIQIFGGERILLKDYTTKNSPFWVNHLVYSEHVTVTNIKVDSHRGNNDGIDIESSRYVLVENSHFRTGDDAVVIKSGRDKDGRDIGRASEHIVIRNNNMAGEDGIGLGSEMSGGISHVYFTDNVMQSGKAAIRFKGSLDRGGIVEHIYVRNMKIAEFDNIIWFQLNYPGVIKGGFPPIYRNLVFENITVEKANHTVIEAHAHKNFPIENVLIKNLTVKQAGKAIVLEHVKNLRLENVSINQESINGQLDWQ
ncbi:MAG: glycoside hydrolase family 28 protein [Kangiellaceae bacterium]|nr:glycoside hydrolase family 28 protein [Kangiellaceae bacterium]